MICFTIVVAYKIYKVLDYPYAIAKQQQGEIAQAEGRLNTLDESNAVLTKRVEFYSREDGAEAVLREHGYIKPGELSIVIESPQNGGTTQQ